MNNSWRTKDDVLKDIGAVNGRRTGAENLHLHVVEGERPPPIRLETPDDDELNYFTGGLGYSAPDDNRGPDLAGISVMLQMVDEMDDNVNRNEPMTVYHDRNTDTISISKLNPCAGVYVPRQFNGGSKQAIVPQYARSFNMFKSRNANKSTNNSPKSNAEIQNTHEEICHSPSNNINTVDERTEIQEKIRSTIIASSNDNSLKSKRRKNVAIATLLQMGAVTSKTEENSIKLIKPDYFENPPKSETKVDDTPVNGNTRDEVVMPSTSSSEMELNYVDPDSIAKVTGWFNSIESPKPKPQPQIQKPLVLKDAVTFKKKSSSIASSRMSETTKENQEKKEPAVEPSADAFEPSSYADELLKKYEDNAKRAVCTREDLGSMLERQLRERDHVIRQKQGQRSG